MMELRRLESPPPAPPRPGAVPVAACRRCGVRFVATPERTAETGAIVAAHEAVCPGGSRNGEVVDPFASLE
jgi:hypothetical protein